MIQEVDETPEAAIATTLLSDNATSPVTVRREAGADRKELMTPEATAAQVWVCGTVLASATTRSEARAPPTNVGPPQYGLPGITINGGRFGILRVRRYFLSEFLMDGR